VHGVFFSWVETLWRFKRKAPQGRSAAESKTAGRKRTCGWKLHAAWAKNQTRQETRKTNVG